MSPPVTFICCLLFVLTASVSESAEAGQQGELKRLIDRYSAEQISALDKESGESHKVYEEKVFHGDVDADGDKDAIVELSFCATKECGPASQTSNIAVFLKSRGGYRFAAGKSFVKFNDDNSIELMGKVKSVSKGKIAIDVYGCKVDDPVCVPKFFFHTTYTLRRGKLVEARS